MIRRRRKKTWTRILRKRFVRQRHMDERELGLVFTVQCQRVLESFHCYYPNKISHRISFVKWATLSTVAKQWSGTEWRNRREKKVRLLNQSSRCRLHFTPLCLSLFLSLSLAASRFEPEYVCIKNCQMMGKTLTATAATFTSFHSFTKWYILFSNHKNWRCSLIGAVSSQRQANRADECKLNFWQNDNQLYQMFLFGFIY